MFIGLLYSRPLPGGSSLGHGNYAVGAFTSQNFGGRFANFVGSTDRGTSLEATGE